MHDYMRAMRQRFYVPPGSEKLSRELEAAHEKLHSRLGRQERKLLLRLMDAEDELRDEASLHSFISGFRLASGIQQELSSQPSYPFDAEEEKRAEALFTVKEGI